MPIDGNVEFRVNDRCVEGVKSVLAFAILCRFSEYVQQQRKKLGLRRNFVNHTRTDLLLALQRAYEAEDDDRMFAIIKSESRSILSFSKDEDLDKVILYLLGSFKMVAEEASTSPGTIA